MENDLLVICTGIAPNIMLAELWYMEIITVLVHPLCYIPDRKITKSLKMTMWADNVKFVKDIVDSKYAKIETAAADVRAIQN